MSSVFDLGASPTGAGGKEAGRRRHAGRTWIGAVLHLAALLAFADGASFLEDGDGSGAQRANS